MKDLNCVTLIGNLTRDCEIKTFVDSGVSVCRFSIAVNDSEKINGSYQDKADFFEVELWGNLGNALSKYLLKGQRIAVNGRLKTYRYEKDGNNIVKYYIKSEFIELLGNKNKQSNQNNLTDDCPF